MREEVITLINKDKLIAIVRDIDLHGLIPLSDALYAGGIRLMEVTFDMRRPETWESTVEGIAALAGHTVGRMHIGAGTVTTPSLVHLAQKAGAEYIVSPDANPDVIRLTRALGLVSLPGAFTATEIMSAYVAGADFVKLFPAATVGVSYLKALRGPLGHIPILAVGGIDEENLQTYLKAGAIGAGIGGKLVNKKWIDSSEFEKITALARTMHERATI